MEAHVPRRNMKTFRRSFQCLAKVGQDMVIETGKDKVVLRVLGQSQAAYAHFSFPKSFFSVFRLRSDAPIKCKVNVRTCLTAFKATGAVEKLVFGLSPDANQLFFEMERNDGMKRVYRFAFETQTNILQADFSRDGCPNMIQIRAKLLAKILQTFHSSLEEITFIATESVLHIKSYVDETHCENLKGALQTEYALDQRDLEEYKVAQFAGSPITFCMRELKAILAFCEALESDVYIFFCRAGVPIVMSNSFDEQNTCVADIIVATLPDEGDDAASQMSRSQATTSDGAQRKKDNAGAADNAMALDGSSHAGSQVQAGTQHTQHTQHTQQRSQPQTGTQQVQQRLLNTPQLQTPQQARERVLATPSTASSSNAIAHSRLSHAKTMSSQVSGGSFSVAGSTSGPYQGEKVLASPALVPSSLQPPPQCISQQHMADQDAGPAAEDLDDVEDDYVAATPYSEA